MKSAPNLGFLEVFSILPSPKKIETSMIERFRSNQWFDTRKSRWQPSFGPFQFFFNSCNLHITCCAPPGILFYFFHTFSFYLAFFFLSFALHVFYFAFILIFIHFISRTVFLFFFCIPFLLSYVYYHPHAFLFYSAFLYIITIIITCIFKSFYFTYFQSALVLTNYRYYIYSPE